MIRYVDIIYVACICVYWYYSHAFISMDAYDMHDAWSFFLTNFNVLRHLIFDVLYSIV